MPLESPVFYIRSPSGLVPPELGKVAIDELLRAPEETLRAIARALDEYPGYLSPKNRRAILSQLLDSSQSVDQFEILLNTGERFQSRHGGIDGIISAIRERQIKGDTGKRPAYTSEQMEELKKRLDIVVKPYASRQRQQKAERLSTATGMRAETIDLICDLRPIFDDERAQVQALLPFTTLKIVATGIDQFPVVFEAILSAQNVESLLESAKVAVSKLNALGHFANKAEVVIPTVDLTETGE